MIADSRHLAARHLAAPFLAVLLATCGGSREAARAGDTAARDTSRGERSAGGTAVVAAPASAAWTVTETGWGPIRAGMNVAEARAALGGRLPEPANRECDHVRPPGASQGLLLMLVRGEVARVDVRDTTVATSTGARVGDSEARIGTLYPGRVQTLPHKYVDGHYLVVRRGTGADSLHRLVFETDGRRVTRYRAGRYPEVEWVEGCS